MAKVIIVLRVMPEDVDVDLDQLLEKTKKVIPEGTELMATEKQPVAFGLQALRLRLGRDEAVGGTDDLEQAISGVDGVAQVEVEIVSRM
jgi:elongation factor 1-beta